MKYTREQKAILQQLEEVHAEHVYKRSEMRRLIEAEYEQKLEALRVRKAVLMIEGKRLGIAKTKLGRSVGTSDWKTIEEYLYLGDKLSPEVEEPVIRFSWTPIVIGKQSIKRSFLQDAQAFELPHFDSEVMEIVGDGWLFIKPVGEWIPYPGQEATMPEGALEWFAENPPE